MVVISVVGLAIVFWFAALACHRNRWRWRVCVVEALRILLVTAAIVLLWQPESQFDIEPEEPSEIVLLVDHSVSMQTRDLEQDGQVVGRESIAERVGADPAWRRLDTRFQRVDEPFAIESDAASDLAAAIDEVSRRHETARSIVLVSDGDWVGERSPVQATSELITRRAAGLRVFTVPLGSATRLPDLELATVSTPTFGVVDKPVRIPFSVRNWFPDLQTVNVSLRQDDRVVQSRELAMRSGERFDGSFSWQSETAGQFKLSVEVDVVDGEVNRQNNRSDDTIDVRDEALRVLLIDGMPRWEFRYLRNALLRDPGIDVSCLLFHPDLSATGGGGKDYLSAWPEEPAELASYDVIFLGDVGVGTDQLTIEQCRQIVGLVEEQATGLVFMPGPRGRQASILQSDLGNLVPVVLDSEKARGIGSSTPGKFSLSDAGRRSLLTQLDDDSQANWSIWESLPGFYWHAAVTRAKAGSQVLAVHATSSNQYGRIPLLVSRGVGAGKVLFIATDSAWRWRMGVEDKYHYRFWGQVIRWMAYQRNMAVGELMRLSYRPEQPQPGDVVTLRASVMTPGGVPADAETVDVQVSSPNGSTRTIRLGKADAEWGVYVGEVQFESLGEHVLQLIHPTESSTVEAKLSVQGRAGEQIGRPARPDIMREIARVGAGEAIAFDQIDQLVDTLNRLPPDPSLRRRIQWWNHPAVLLAMVAGLALFWIGRKWSGGM